MWVADIGLHSSIALHFFLKDRRFTTLMSLSCMHVVGCNKKNRNNVFLFCYIKGFCGLCWLFSNLSTSRYLRSPRLRILVRYVSRYLGSVEDRKTLITRMICRKFSTVCIVFWIKTSFSIKHKAQNQCII